MRCRLVLPVILRAKELFFPFWVCKCGSVGKAQLEKLSLCQKHPKGDKRFVPQHVPLSFQACFVVAVFWSGLVTFGSRKRWTGKISHSMFPGTNAVVDGHFCRHTLHFTWKDVLYGEADMYTYQLTLMYARDWAQLVVNITSKEGGIFPLSVIQLNGNDLSPGTAEINLYLLHRRWEESEEVTWLVKWTARRRSREHCLCSNSSGFGIANTRKCKSREFNFLAQAIRFRQNGRESARLMWVLCSGDP